MLPALALLFAPAAPPTFAADVAPILWKNCASCHRPGEVGPFPLLSYADAAKRAGFLAEQAESRRMPPWHPEPGHGEFRDARRLSEAEIKTLRAWADAGAPEGDPSKLPALPAFPEGWQLGQPDLVVKMPEPFAVPADGRDVLQCFVIPLNLDEDKWVAAWEFRPDKRSVVHHAIAFLDSTGQARLRDKLDSGPGYRTFGGPGIVPTGGLGAWAPGSTPRMLPDGVGRLLRKGSDLVLQVHYHPSGKPERDQSSLGIYFAKKPVKQPVGGIALRSRNLYIPAGKSDHKVTAQSDPLPADVHAIGIGPHMHYIGKSMKVDATLPDGSTVPLIWIKDWDFNWQGAYQYAKPVKLPKGTVVKLEALYDNSSANPRNPSDPPQNVKWGEQTTDEMCLLGIQVVTDTRADLRAIMAMRNNRLATVLGGGGAPKDSGEPDSRADRLLKAGVPIPERGKRLLQRWDKDNDGKLTGEEIDAMPGPIRDRVRKAIEERLAGETGGDEKR